MQINRNNYEEFFLLYVDNELSAEEKNAVDVFVQDNPDLQEELLMLQQSVIKPEAVIFKDKQSLISNDDIPAGLQEKLLLYLDNEAGENDTAFVLQLIQSDDAVKKEWDILRQTKLDAGNAVVFKDKHLLYKKEPGKIAGMRWWRMAAAAILIGFGIWGVVTYSTKNNNTVEVTSNNATKENSKPAETTAPKQIQPAVTTNPAAVAVNEDKQDKQAPGNIKPQNKKLPTAITDKKNIAATTKENNVSELQQTRLEKLNNTGSNKNDIATVTPQKQESNIVKEISNLPEVNENGITKNEFAVAASFTNNGNDNNQTAFDEEDSKKGRTKVGAFFKKVKRMIERKTNTENSDNSIKVANLSFAVQ